MVKYVCGTREPDPVPFLDINQERDFGYSAGS